MIPRETGAPRDTNLARSPEVTRRRPLGSNGQRAHRVAGRLALLPLLAPASTHAHTHTQSTMLETSDKKAGACARALTHTHEWLEGKSSCRLSMTSNKRTIENNKTALTAPLREKRGEGKKKFPFVTAGNFTAPRHSDSRSSQRRPTAFKWVDRTARKPPLLDTVIGKKKRERGKVDTPTAASEPPS